MRVLLLLLSLGLTSLACGGDDTAPSASATPPPGPQASPTPANTARIDFPASPAPQAGAGVVVDVRVGAHPEGGGLDRIVFEFKAGTSSGWVEYVDKSQVISCGPGDVVPLQGQAALKVHFNSAGQHEDYVPTNAPRQLQGPGNAILESKAICDFEAVLEWGIGTSGIRPFTVTTLDNPKRLVIDVRW
jgi:hypothetical protein